jgi:hypothetical protein
MAFGKMAGRLFSLVNIVILKKKLTKTHTNGPNTDRLQTFELRIPRSSLDHCRLHNGKVPKYAVRQEGR